VVYHGLFNDSTRLASLTLELRPASTVRADRQTHRTVAVLRREPQAATHDRVYVSNNGDYWQPIALPSRFVSPTFEVIDGPVVPELTVTITDANGRPVYGLRNNAHGWLVLNVDSGNIVNPVTVTVAYTATSSLYDSLAVTLAGPSNSPARFEDARFSARVGRSSPGPGCFAPRALRHCQAFRAGDGRHPTENWPKDCA
jgi:hypothetical protein